MKTMADNRISHSLRFETGFCGVMEVIF